MGTITVPDASGNGHDLAGTDAGITAHAGYADGGQSFVWDPTFSPALTSSPSAWAASTTGLTVEAVVLMSPAADFTSGPIVVFDQTGGGRGMQFSIVGGALVFSLKTNGGGFATHNVAIPGGYLDGLPHLVTSAFSLTADHVFRIDGTQVGGNEGTAYGIGSVGWDTSEPFRVGHKSSGERLQGVLDDLAVYDGFLSAPRSAAHAAARAAGTGYAASVLADSPLAYWKFDAAAGGWSIGVIG